MGIFVASDDSVATFVAMILLVGTGLDLTSVKAIADPGGIGLISAPAQASEEVLEGDLEVLIEDSSSGSRTLYFLRRGRDRIALRFATPPRNLRSGARVRVRGSYETGGWFRVVAFERMGPAG